MRKFLEILIGSRGEFEGVEVVELDVVDLESYVKSYLEEQKDSLLDGLVGEDLEDAQSYFDEFYGGYVIDNYRCDIGLGEEYGRTLIDVEYEPFVEYCKEKGYSVNMDWDELEYNQISDILEMFIW